MYKVGIIGLGVGEQHIEGYRKHPKCEVVALCDMNSEVRAAAMRKYPELKITAEANHILDDPEIEVVSIASYDHLHFDQIKKGLHNEKHLFVEKPLVLKEEHAEEIWQMLAKKPHLKISSNLVMRKIQRFVDLKQRLDQGEFGQLSYINACYHYGRVKKLTEGWRGKSNDYTIILGGGIHIVDLLLWLTQEKVKRVFAVGNKIQTRGTSFSNYDLVTSTLEFETGMIATLTCNFGAVTPHFHQLEVFGTQKSFVNGIDRAIEYDAFDVKNGDFNYLVNTPDFPKYAGKKVLDTHYGTISKGEHIYEFVEAIDKDTVPKINKQEIFKSMAVCFAIERSLMTGEKETIKYF